MYRFIIHVVRQSNILSTLSAVKQAMTRWIRTPAVLATRHIWR